MKKTIWLGGICFFVFLWLIAYSCKKEEKPTIVTSEITDISVTSAITGGNVKDEGSSLLFVRGVCWSTSDLPTIDDNKTTDGIGVGEFTSKLENLSARTMYYVRAYATNKIGTAYGEEISFTTNEITTPSLTTSEITSISQTSAMTGGIILSDNGDPVTLRGVCWSLSPGPTTSDNKTEDGSGIGSYTSTIHGLQPETNYYVRSYAENGAGIAYGNELSFSTFNRTVTDIDWNIYNTVIIGNQRWMKENLNVTHFKNGDVISNVSDSVGWINTTDGAFCYFNNDSNYVNVYGSLYNFYAVVDPRNICPTGWHVPTDYEWKELEIYLSMTQEQAYEIGMRGTNEGGKLKEIGSINWDPVVYHWYSDIGSTNETGFTALPGGYRHFTGVFGSIGYEGTWWSSSEYSDNSAWKRELHYNLSQIIRNYESKKEGCSVRCIKD